MTDQERLDYLEKVGFSNIFSISGTWYIRRNHGQPYIKYPTLRQAIDAIIKK
jgi:hypothetical protein